MAGMDTGYSPRVDAALAMAAFAHRTQKRKGTEIPYIVHPVHVAMILMRHGFEEDVVIAGVLHDTVEDTDVSLDQIQDRFGAGVAGLVGAVSEAKTDDGGERRPWRDRKNDQIAHLERGDARVAALKCADSLHNLRSTIADLRVTGHALWTRFNAGPADWLWYYGGILRLARARLGEHPIVDELAGVVEELAALTA